MSPALHDLVKSFGGKPADVAAPLAPTMSDNPKVEERLQLAVFNLDPQLAESWLARNKGNRNIRANKVAQYAHDMARGAWMMTGETIKFDTNGDLVDGQHRLMAVIEADATVRVAVQFGLDPEARHYVDTGAARTAQDALRMKGETSPAILGASARLGVLFERKLRTGAPVSHADVFDYIEAHPELRDAASYAGGILHKVDLPPSIIAYARFRFAQVDSDAADDFFGKLANLNDLNADDPILRLAHRMRAANRNGEKISKTVLAVTLFRTWNTWRQGRTMARVLLANADAVLPDPE